MRIKGENGNTLIIALMSVGVLTFVGASVTKMATSRLEATQQANLAPIAEQIRKKVVGLVVSPAGWGAIITNHNSLFNAGAINAMDNLPPTQKLLNLYSVDATGAPVLYYETTNTKAGFNALGKPCSNSNGHNDGYFDSKNGNDKCPFRYDVRIENRELRHGSWVETVKFELIFKPKSAKLILNSKQTNYGNQAGYSFTITRNFSSASVETSCISLMGTYNSQTAKCSIRLTQDANCTAQYPGSPQIYTGPNAQPCASPKNTTTCPAGTALKGFETGGTPACSPIQT